MTDSDRPVEGVVLHHVLGTGWVHTHGMTAFGLPELEIRDVPDLFVEAAAGILRTVCHYLKTPGVVVRVGETMALSPKTAFRFVRPDPIPGEDEHYRDERWRIVEIESSCDGCRG